MMKPEIISPNDSINRVWKILDTPLVTKGWTSLLLTKILVLEIMVCEAGRLHPERSWLTCLGVAILTMTVILGSDWCHNLAHAATVGLS